MTPYNWVEYCKGGLEILVTKNKLYGDSIQETGLLGAVVECVAKVARLKVMVIQNPSHGLNQQVEIADTLLDLHNYSLIGMAMLEQKNWDGRKGNS